MRKILLAIFVVVLALNLSSCKKDNRSLRTDQTLFVYMPWSTNLTTYFHQNLADFETALQGDILKNNRLVVFFATSATEATMFEMIYKNGENLRTTLKEYNYTNPDFTTTAGIASILNDVITFAPAKRYAMTVSCHGMGWLPVSATKGERLGVVDSEKYHYEYEGVPLTRYFGGTTSDVQAEVTTLAAAIKSVGIKMDYILFDDCYMSTVEVAYDLKDVTNYLIASPTEVMAYGFPYHVIGKYMIGNFDLKGICDGFHEFYKNYVYPYGTIGVTVTAELSNLAAVTKEVNRRFAFDPALLNSVQEMDGYSPVIFFDMGDYVSKLCTDAELLNRFQNQLKRTVPVEFSLHTQNYYSASRGVVAIASYSGVTISDPSVSAKAVGKTNTAWYKATH